MITLNLIPLSELERKSNRFKNTPKPKTEELERFRNFCEILLKSVPQTDNERQLEDKLTNFLATTFYDRNQLVANVEHKDYVIKSKIDDTIKVIIELKKQQSTDFPTNGDCNKKALHELILYFFDEKFAGNNQIKTLIATNGTEFYIFEAGKFNAMFAEGSLYKQYQKKGSAEYGNRSKEFYELARQHISSDEGTLDCIYFDISDYKKHASKLYRLFSPAYLLGEITHTDANDINKNFYNELLHIIGLEERKDKGNKITICRKGAEKGKGSLFELALYEIQKKTINEEKAEAIALQLCIQWINRLLFLKLLETQICKYKESNKKFLDCENIRNFNDLDNLFFKVLGIEADKREQDFKDKFPQVPYLNSALFEPNEAEDKNIFIRALNSNEILPFYPQTCLVFDKKNKNQLTTLQYLLKFLDSYDFGSTVNDENADNDKIINASILGRIFEKINGYKDGAVFTPSFITMYMCRETIQKAVMDKFKDTYKWQCKTLLEVKNRLSDSIYDRYSEYNAIINSLKICDPAVGSGHFLVSALNEIIRIKNYLGLLYYKGEKISCNIDIQNDELVISRGDKIFSYDYTDRYSQQLQECLFHEKRTIIENCLFGVDINPNSVNICRLRLWIELLKNTYYRQETGYKQLETLPNIDINIKCGNSLISALKIKIGEAATNKGKSIKEHIDQYKEHVRQYKETKDKNEKANLNRYISNIKSELTPTVQLRLELSEEDRIYNEEQQKNNIYKNSLEWMIEFPEVLDDEGRFCGFDIIIGNPPYIPLQDNQGLLGNMYKDCGYTVFEKTGDIYCLFYENGINLLKQTGVLCYITSNKWMRAAYGKKLRTLLAKENIRLLIDFAGVKIFENVTVDPNILLLNKKGTSSKENNESAIGCITTGIKIDGLFNLGDFVKQHSCSVVFSGSESWVILNKIEQSIKSKIEKYGIPLKDWDIQINYGIKTGCNEAFIISTEKKEEILAACKTAEERNRTAEIIRPILRGRDIKRYAYDWAGLWLIYIPWHFPLHHDKTIAGSSQKAEKAFKNECPVIYEHLSKYKTQLSARNKSETGIRYEWYALQRWGANYSDDFDKPKIAWKRIGSILRFSYDEKGYMPLDSVCFCTGKHLKYLVALLNSKTGRYLLKDSPKTGTGDLLISVQAVNPIKIPIPNEQTEKQVENILNIIIENENKDSVIEAEEQIEKINKVLYNFTEEEQKFIQSMMN